MCQSVVWMERITEDCCLATASRSEREVKHIVYAMSLRTMCSILTKKLSPYQIAHRTHCCNQSDTQQIVFVVMKRTIFF